MDNVPDFADDLDVAFMFWRGHMPGTFAHWCHEYDGLPVDETDEEWALLVSPAEPEKLVMKLVQLTNLDTRKIWVSPDRVTLVQGTVEQDYGGTRSTASTCIHLGYRHSVVVSELVEQVLELLTTC